MKALKLLIVLCLGLSACGAAVEDVPPEEIVAKASQAMGEMEGFSFRLSRTGNPVFVDPTGVVAFREAEGVFVSPDRVQGRVKVIAPGVVTEVSIVGIGDEEWETNFLSGEWMKVPPEYAFRPAVLFEPTGGIQRAIADYLTQVELVDIETIEEMPGLDLYHIHGQMDGANVQAITFGLIDPQVLEIDLWVTPQSFELQRAIIQDPVNEGQEEGTTWQFDFWNFGQVEEILPPL